MHMISIPGVILLTAVGAAASTTGQLTLPYDEKLRGTDGYPLYVDDATIRSTIPWLKNAGERLSTCHQSMTIPEMLHVEFTPTATGTHRGTANTLNCDHTRGADHFACESTTVDQMAYFDDKPDRYFTIEPGTNVDDALAMFHSLMTHEVKFVAGVSDPQLDKKKGRVATIKYDGSAYVVSYGDCGCTGSMTIEREANGSNWRYVATRAGWRICI